MLHIGVSTVYDTESTSTQHWMKGLCLVGCAVTYMFIGHREPEMFILALTNISRIKCVK